MIHLYTVNALKEKFHSVSFPLEHLYESISSTKILESRSL